MTDYGKKFLSALIATALALVISIVSLTVGFILKPESPADDTVASVGFTSDTSENNTSGNNESSDEHGSSEYYSSDDPGHGGIFESDYEYESYTGDEEFDPTNMKNKMKTAVWFSYYDLDFRNMNETKFKAKVNEMFNNVKVLCADTVICQVRPFSDAFYYSDIFPFSSYVTTTQGGDPGYDPLAYLVSAAHERGLKIEAWLNPYRITTPSQGTDLARLADSNPAKKWLTDDNDKNDRYVLEHGGALYYNPSVPEVRQLIIDGVKEIVSKYAVDGIHFDDYFYPTSPKLDDVFDTDEYEIYKASEEKPMSIGDWRRNNVNELIKGVYKAAHDKGKTFGVSPSYHISKDKSDYNYTDYYADIAMWMSNEGYIDYIAPQLYFGYEYPSERCRFDNLLKLWTSIPRLSSVKLYIGVAAYKVGEIDAGSNEWQKYDDILARQALDISKSKADGIFIYNYDTIMGSSDIQLAERDRLITMFYEINRKS